MIVKATKGGTAARGRLLIPNQLRDKLYDHIKSLENTYDGIRNETPTLTVITGDFNARSPVFWEGNAETRDWYLFSELFYIHQFN